MTASSGSPSVDDLAALAGDIAGTFRSTPSSGALADPAAVDADWEALGRDGDVILPELLTAEEFTLSTSRDVVREVSEDIRRMLGYSIHPPFIGMVDGMHPKRLLLDG